MTIYVGSTTSTATGSGAQYRVYNKATNDQPAVFTSIANRDTYFTTNPSELSAINNQPLAVGIGTTAEDPSQSNVTQWFARINGEWAAIVATLVGASGANGVDALDIQFTSITARDTFFTANPSKLRAGLPITVHDSALGENVVRQQVWRGANTPSTYNAATDGVFFQAATIRADTSSFELGDVHKITSGGENVYFENQDSDVNYFPPWQSVGDHRTPSGRTVQNRPTARTYAALQAVEFGGAVATSGAADYNIPFTLPANESVHGVRVIPAEAYDGEITYRVTRVRTEGNITVYNHTEEIDTTIGTALDIWFEVPLDGRQGTETIVQLVKPNGTYLSVRPTLADPTDPYTRVQLRNFTDDGLAYLSETTGSHITTTLEALTGTDRLDFNSLKNTPDLTDISVVFERQNSNDLVEQSTEMAYYSVETTGTSTASVTLFDATSTNVGKVISVINNRPSASMVTINPSSGDTIQFATGNTLTLSVGETAEFLYTEENVIILLNPPVTMPTVRTDEEIRDVAYAGITAGTNVSVSVDDANDTVTISATDTNTQRTDEEIRDVSYAGIRVTGNGSVSIDDAADTVTIHIGGTPPTRTEDTYVNSQADTVVGNFTTTGANSADYAVTQTLAIPTFTGNRYVVIAQPSDEPDITSITIGGINQLGAFTKSATTGTVESTNYSFWYSNNTLIGSIVSGQNIIISRS